MNENDILYWGDKERVGRAIEIRENNEKKR